MGTGLGTENKIMGYLTNKKIDNVNDKGVYIDGDGLRLRVDNKSNKNWVFRYHIFGQSKDMGLGKYPVVSLKDARRKMVEAKKLVYDGKDPLKIKRETQLEKKKKKITFQQISEGKKSLGIMTRCYAARKDIMTEDSFVKLNVKNKEIYNNLYRL